MLHGKWYAKSNGVRSVDDRTYEVLISELTKPGLTSIERENIANELRRLRRESRQWEEKNEVLSVQRGESVGVLIGVGSCAFGLILGIGVSIMKKLI